MVEESSLAHLGRVLLIGVTKSEGALPDVQPFYRAMKAEREGRRKPLKNVETGSTSTVSISVLTLLRRQGLSGKASWRRYPSLKQRAKSLSPTRPVLELRPSGRAAEASLRATFLSPPRPGHQQEQGKGHRDIDFYMKNRIPVHCPTLHK